MNRAVEPNNVCATVTKPFQFSWTTACLVPSKRGWALRPECSPKDKSAWLKATQIARAALKGKFKPLTCADHYHAKSVRPPWSKRFKVVKRFQSHIFYASPRASLSCNA